jgi:hypothetical protein
LSFHTDRVNRVVLPVRRSLPVYPDERIFDVSFADYRQLGPQLYDAFGVCENLHAPVAPWQIWASARLLLDQHL